MQITFWKITVLLLLAILEIQSRPFKSHFGEYMVSPKVVRDLDTHHLYAAAAMCKKGLPDLEWDCGMRCKGGTNGTIMYRYFEEKSTDTVGYIAVSRSLKAIIVAFRGTESVKNWILDLVIAPTAINLTTFVSPPDHLVGGLDEKYPRLWDRIQVHMGFLKSYTVVSNTVRSGIKSLLRRLKKPDYTIHFVGQSLGGSVASLAAMDVSLHMPEIADRIRLYTYGQPRTGNKEWAEWMSTRFSNQTHRVTRFRDSVPRLPLRPMGFWHFKPEYHIDAFRHIWFCPVKGHRQESDYCANVGWVPMPGAAHRDYFYPGSFEPKC